MVFWISMILITFFVLWGAIFPQNLYVVSTSLLDVMIEKFGWFYLIVAFTLLIFSLYLAFSRYGHIVLGKDDDKPEFNDLTWFAMLFSAGMGIGLVFWGVAEPVFHYMEPPTGLEGYNAESARVGMRYAFFHWGLQPWAIYTVISLALAYFQFRKGEKGLISSVFKPILGDKVNGPIGKTIDILAVIATAFGVATSLGLGVLQINGGINYLFGVENSKTVQFIIIGTLTILYLISAMTGLKRGISILSNANIIVASGLMIFVLFLGPTSFIFDTLTTTIGSYAQNLIQMSLRLSPFTGNEWIAKWTLFYWAWWIAWAPFVGMFIARISKGRTIKEFVLSVLFVPTLFSFIWFSTFGGTALNLEMFHNAGITEAVNNDMTTALFITLEHLPLGAIISFLAIVLIITFFITSADSATFVLGMLSTKGDLNPSNRVKFVWGILQSSVAAVLLVSGGLEALQTISIITALPFAVIMLFICYSIQKALKEEKVIYIPRYKKQKDR